MTQDDAGITRRGEIRRLRHCAEEAIPLFGIEPVAFSLLAHLFNTTFAVRGADGSRYVLRIHQREGNPIHPTRTRAVVASELWWLHRLRGDLDLPVPDPVHTPDGEDVITVTPEGEAEPRLCVLFRWMDGRFLDRGLTPVHLERVGRLTARLHDHSAQLTVPPSFSRERVDAADGEVAESVIRLFRDRWSAEGAGVVRAVLERVHRTEEEIGPAPDTFGLVHADIHQENFLFGGGEVRLIDFDDCGWGHYVYDLAVTVHNIDTHPRGAALQRALLAGYRQMRDLSPEHERTIGVFYVLRELQMLTWFLQARDNPALSDRSAHIANGLIMMGRFVRDGTLPGTVLTASAPSAWHGR